MSQTIRSILVQKSSPSSAHPLTPSLQSEPAGPTCCSLSEPIIWKSQPWMHKLEIALTLPKETSNLRLCTAQTKSCCLGTWTLKCFPSLPSIFMSFLFPGQISIQHSRDPVHIWLLGGYWRALPGAAGKLDSFDIVAGLPWSQGLVWLSEMLGSRPPFEISASYSRRNIWNKRDSCPSPACSHNQPYTLSLSSWGVGVGSDKQAVYQAFSEREEPLFPLGFFLSQSWL